VRRGTNLLAVAGYNQTVVLDSIRRSVDGMSRVELAGTTGLSAQTVSNVSRRLLDQGLIREAGTQIDGPGKPRTILQLEPRSGYAIGVHMDPAVVTCVLLDLEGSVVAHSRTRTTLSADAHETVAKTALAVDTLIATSAVSRERVLGLGVAAPGPIDSERGVLVRPPLILNWSNFPVRDSLSAATGLPVLVAKDVTAAAVAERWTNTVAPSRNFAFVYYGTGIGVGLVLNDEVYTGASQNAGDIGHVQVDPDGSLCDICGRRGCFGESVRPYRLVKLAIELGVLAAPADELDFDSVDDMFTKLTMAADRGDAVAQTLIDRSIRNTATFLTNVANLLDIDRIVFGGPFWARVASRYLEKLPAYLRELTTNNLIHSVKVAGCVVGEDVAAVGAACLVLDETFSPHSSRLLIRSGGAGA
jgi:predicted NBD/HSP70 family sugar kinase